MSDADEKGRDPVSDTAAPEDPQAGSSQVAADDASPYSTVQSNDNGEAVPCWRQVEIMRERQELKGMLDKYNDHDLELDEEIFGSGEERQASCKATGDKAEEGEEEIPEAPEDEPFEDE